MGGPERDLDAAGITDPRLRASYLRARALHAVHGRTYFLATMLLPPWKRPYVHALYGFARYADEIVDDLGSSLSDAERAAWLRGWSRRFLAALDGRRQSGHASPASSSPVASCAPAQARPHAPASSGTSAADGQLAADSPATHGPWEDGLWEGEDGAEADGQPGVLPAVLDTIRRFDLPASHFEAFLESMAMDLTVTGYQTWEDLMVYVHGSAAVIGLQMLPILEPLDDSAHLYARDLGVAFQLANFIRDVGEDLRRGRVYLPQSSLDLFGVTRERLAAGVVDGPIRRLLAFEIARARELFRAARPGIRLLHPTSRDCIMVAFRLYSSILDEVERADYQVLDQRVSVGIRTRLAVAGPAAVRAARARRRHARHRRAEGAGRAGWPPWRGGLAQSSSRPPR